MSKLRKLTKYWAYPDRRSDRQQLTLRIPYDVYAKLHALKRVYKRPVNDMISDILEAGLDEIIEELPSRKVTLDEAQDIAFQADVSVDDVIGSIVGPRADFDSEYRRLLEKSEILEKVSDEDTKKDSKNNEGGEK